MDKLILSSADLETIRQGIQAGIRMKVAEAKAKGVVVGLSGGIDSSLVAKISRDAKVDVYGLLMPETGVTNPNDVKDAIKLAEKLGIKYQVIELDRILTSLRNGFQWHEFQRNRIRSFGNVKARLRMTLLYLTANLDDRIVLGTGNRTELLMGYFTKHGDGGADFLPIGSLYKTQVRQLAKYIGVPDVICKKTPTAGLWVGQTDEGELGLDYGNIDRILHLLYDKGFSIKEASMRTGLPESKARKIKRASVESLHKRALPEIISF